MHGVGDMPFTQEIPIIWRLLPRNLEQNPATCFIIHLPSVAFYLVSCTLVFQTRTAFTIQLKKVGFFSVKYNAGCRFVIYSFYNVEELSFYS
jgi:hypothetical protein